MTPFPKPENMLKIAAVKLIDKQREHTEQLRKLCHKAFEEQNPRHIVVDLDNVPHAALGVVREELKLAGWKTEVGTGDLGPWMTIEPNIPKVTVGGLIDGRPAEKHLG